MLGYYCRADDGFVIGVFVVVEACSHARGIVVAIAGGVVG